MPTFSRRIPAPGNSVRLDLQNVGRAFPPDQPPLAVRLSFLFLTLAIGISFFHAGATGLRAWNCSLAAIGLLSITYWPFQRSAVPLGSRSRPLAALAIPIYVALQLLPLPRPVVQLASPGERAIVEALGSIGHSSLFTPISVSPGVTAGFLFRIIGYLLLFLLVREFSSRSRQSSPWLPALPLIAIGLTEAVWGLTQKFQGAEVHGGFANKNHFAGLLEMVLPFAVARTLYLCSHENPDGDNRYRRFIGIACFALVSILLFLALLDSESKMGLISGVASLAVVGILWTLSRLHGWHRWLALGCIALLCVFGLVFLPSDELVIRFGRVLTSSQNAGEGRWPIWVDTVSLIKAFPIFGCGLGNFQTAFLKYQTSVIDNTFAFAHNDYLQLIAELGLTGALIIAATIVPIAARPFRVSLRYAKPQARYVALGCAGAITAIGLHSFADFNLYIPANAAVLAWILGIAASLAFGPRRVLAGQKVNSVTPKLILVSLGLLLVSYSSAWIAFHAWYPGDVKAEHTFCGFGICDMDAAVTAATPAAKVQEYLERDPTSPYRWADLGESLDRSGTSAANIFRNAVQFGPYLAPVLLRVASFDVNHGQTAGAVSLTSRILLKTDTYDRPIFYWYDSHHLPLRAVLDGALAGNPHASQAYFQYLLGTGNLPDAATAWKWLLSNSYVSESLAHEYVGVLAGQLDYQEAALAWSGYLGSRRDGYLESNWIYNGGFESEPTGGMFDWEVQQREGVTAGLDAEVFQAGHRSLRLRFDGKQNLDYQQVKQTAYVSPGTYRFEAYIRTSDITTDEGIGVRIFDPENPARLDILTDAVTGTHDWTKVTREITVTNPTTILELRVDRKPSLRFDSNISGTAWVDGVRLMKN